MEIDKPVSVKNVKDWRKWLQQHHGRETHCWLIFSRKDGKPNLAYFEAVYEALCFGWIDSTVKKYDEQTTAQRYSPRNKRSRWTELNKERVRWCIRNNKMTEAGMAVLPEMDIKKFVVDEHIMERVKACPQTLKHFKKLPPLYMRVRIDNIQTLKKSAPEVFESRLQKFLAATKENKLYGQWDDDGKLSGE